MAKPPPTQLSRREREIMDIIYRLGEANVHDVLRQMPDDAGYDSVRVTLGILARKGHLESRKDGRRNVFRPTVPVERATRSAVRNLLLTFFGGSTSKAVLTLLDMSSSRLTQRELDDIAAFIETENKR